MEKMRIEVPLSRHSFLRYQCLNVLRPRLEGVSHLLRVPMPLIDSGHATELAAAEYREGELTPFGHSLPSCSRPLRTMSAVGNLRPSRASSRSSHVRFAPKATEVLHCREATRRANKRLMHCNKVGAILRSRGIRRTARRAEPWPLSDRACRSLR